MKKEVQLLVRVDAPMRRKIERERRRTGKTLKAITRQAFTEYFRLRKRESVAAPE